MVDNEGARYDLLPLTIGNNTMQKLFSAALVTCTIFTGSSFGPAALVASTIVAGISFVPEPANAAVGVTRTTRHLNIRRGPGTQYRRVTTIPPGRIVNVKGCKGNWCAVTFRRHRGYVYAGYLSTQKTIITSPVN